MPYNKLAHVPLLALAALTLAGCGRTPVQGSPAQDSGSPLAPDSKLPGCPDQRLVCISVGPSTLCSCDWLCSGNGDRCYGARPTPPGQGWSCAFDNSYIYRCARPGSKGAPPPGDSQWFCNWDNSQSSWSCAAIKTPQPPGKGPWQCSVNNAASRLVCDRGGPTPNPGGKWNCRTHENRKYCVSGAANKGLPPGGHSWSCHQAAQGGVPSWICHGTASGASPPGGEGWTCVKYRAASAGGATWRCRLPADKDPVPPGGGYWACAKSSALGGTQCERVPAKPAPPTPFPPPGAKCLPGTRAWCDGLMYSGWGQVRCLPTGRWDTKTVNGKSVVNCQELADGRKPATLCACHHHYFNPQCCERVDCVVPVGGQGQVCPASQGRLCDYCSPAKPECTGASALCVVTNSLETFCGQQCSDKAGCPAGYKCMKVKLKVGSTMQCIPSDLSCFY